MKRTLPRFPPMKLQVEDMDATDLWVVYALDPTYNKRLMIRVGCTGFRVIHGKEIVYEGIHLPSAIKAFNAITKPNPSDIPKLEN